MTQTLKSHAYLSVSTLSQTSRIKENVSLPFISFLLQLTLHVFCVFFIRASAQCVLAHSFCKCVGVQGLLETKYAGSSIFFFLTNASSA